MAMATSAFLLPALFPKPNFLAAPLHPSLPRGRQLRCSPNGAAVPESPKPASRRGRKKSPSPSPSAPKAKATRRRTKKESQDSDSESEEEPAKRASRRTRKSKKEQEEVVAQTASDGTEETIQGSEEEDGLEVGSDYDDGEDFANDWPPLVCCFGAPRWEFVPTVRVSDRQMHPDQYSTWRHLQWEPPEFARAPGSAASNVAIALTRLGGRGAVLGKVVFETVIPRNVRLSEAPSHGLPALIYDHRCSGSQAYIALAREMIGRLPVAAQAAA